MRGNFYLKIFDFWIGSLIIVLIFPLKFIKKIFFKKDFLFKNVAIISLGPIGDSLLISSSFPELFKKYGKFTLICYEGNYHVFDRLIKDDFFDLKVINLSNPFSIFFNYLFKYDYVVDCNQWVSISSIITFFISKRSSGFKTKGYIRHLIFNDIVFHNSNIHEINNFRNLFDTSNANSNFFVKSIINSGEIYQNRVVIHPFAGGYRNTMRELPKKKWKVIIDYLLDNNYQVFLTGSNEDLSKTFYLPNHKNFFDVRNKFDLYDLAIFLNSSHLLIIVNTGIMHLASLLGVNLICINGPTKNLRWGPINKNSISINLPTSLGGNFLNLGFEYPKGYNYSMNRLDVNKIIHSINKFK